MLKKANEKLNLLREFDPTSGGLIVATSVTHAKSIQNILKQYLNEDAYIVTYLEHKPVALIKRFKFSTAKWIISVGMISEGTNIPRLKICCYLSRVKTELYFRQVLGRILRANGADNEFGYFYMPAETALTEYAYRVSEDVPIENIIKLETIPSSNNTNSSSLVESHINSFKPHSLLELNEFESFTKGASTEFSSSLSQGYEHSLGLFGHFKQKVLSLSEL